MPLRWQSNGLNRLLLIAVALFLSCVLIFRLSFNFFDGRYKDTLESNIDLGFTGHRASNVNHYCEDRYGRDYLKTFRDRHAQYCSVDPDKSTVQSGLTCFSNNVDPNRIRTDSFCLAGPAMYDPANKKFKMNCPLRALTEDEVAKGVQPFHRFPAYWYETGPRHIFTHYFDLNAQDALVKGPHAKLEAPVILIKRENANFNMWHSLMEIMSSYWSLLILSQTLDTWTGDPLYSWSEESTIWLLDDIADGPYFDLWSLVTSVPVRRITDVKRDMPFGKVIVPLPGGSNPLWQGDWKSQNCTSSKLLNDFSQRALKHYAINTNIVTRSTITLTYIDRVTKRRLIDQERLIAALRRAYPRITINVVDYATYPFEEQLRISAQSDILVGVHGAGLTHVMFMPETSAIVELMPFSLDHHGFKNMARMRNTAYYQAKSADAKEKTHAKGDWQEDDVYVEENTFVNTVGEAIENLSKSRAIT
jgi:EGF domain-specific O-GlcNAc transferase